MKKPSKTIIFFGNERLATGVNTEALSLQALIEAGYGVAAVVLNYEAGKSRNSRPLEIRAVADKYKIPVYLPSKLDNQVINQLKSYRAAAAVLVAYGKLVPGPVIEMFPRGIINVHPSLLPLHRGPTPIESVILGGDKKTGVSLMQLTEEMDAGPIYGQSELLLKTNETKQELANELLEIGKSMLLELLPSILDGTVIALPQDESRASYDRLLSKPSGIIDWSKPAKQIEREIRAYAEWPKSHTKLANIDVIITSSKVLNLRGEAGKILLDNKKLVVYCGKGALEIVRLKPTGKKEMDAPAFLAGHSTKLS